MFPNFFQKEKKEKTLYRIYQNLSEFLQFLSKNHTFNFNRAREDVLGERSEERDG